MVILYFTFGRFYIWTPLEWTLLAKHGSDFHALGFAWMYSRLFLVNCRATVIDFAHSASEKSFCEHANQARYQKLLNFSKSLDTTRCLFPYSFAVEGANTVRYNSDGTPLGRMSSVLLSNHHLRSTSPLLQRAVVLSLLLSTYSNLVSLCYQLTTVQFFLIAHGLHFLPRAYCCVVAATCLILETWGTVLLYRFASRALSTISSCTVCGTPPGIVFFL